MLTTADLATFERDGFLHVRGAIPREIALRCRDDCLEQLQVADGAGSWPEPVVRGLVLGNAVTEAATAPRLNEAVAPVLEGEAWSPRPNLGLFVVRLPHERDPGDAGWHIDSSFQRAADGPWCVNWRSRGRGLLLLCLLSDVGDDDAPTEIAVGSHRLLPSLLHPFGDEGVEGLHAPLPAPEKVVRAVGEAGDVFVCHPFLMHRATWPHRGATPRVVAQPPISIAGDLELDASRPSSVARCIVDALGAP